MTCWNFLKYFIQKSPSNELYETKVSFLSLIIKNCTIYNLEISVLFYIYEKIERVFQKKLKPFQTKSFGPETFFIGNEEFFYKIKYIKILPEFSKISNVYQLRQKQFTETNCETNDTFKKNLEIKIFCKNNIFSLETIEP